MEWNDGIEWNGMMLWNGMKWNDGIEWNELWNEMECCWGIERSDVVE